jgi:hypothetical protein
MPLKVKALVAVSIAAAVLAGCGGSSKPSYCSAVTELENSIKALPTTDVIKNGTSGLQSALTKVENNAKSVVDAAKSDFPNETNAVKSSVDSLSSSIKQLGSSATPAAIAQVGVQASAVVTAVKDLVSATSSKCG